MVGGSTESVHQLEAVDQLNVTSPSDQRHSHMQHQAAAAGQQSDTQDLAQC